MISPIDSDQLWLVLMRTNLGEPELRVWIAPPGRDGLRRIFRVREENAIPVAATTMSVLTHSKLSLSPVKRWQKITRGDLFVAWVSSDTDIPSLVGVQAHSEDEAIKALEDDNQAPLGLILMEQVKNILPRLQELLQGVSAAKPDLDLTRNPPPHDAGMVPDDQDQEVGLSLVRNEYDVWDRVIKKN